MTAAAGPLREVHLPSAEGPTVRVRLGDGPLRPFLLVHAIASGVRPWDAVAHRLLRAGHTVATVDLGGRGRSGAPGRGYGTDATADRLATLVENLGFTGGRAPIAVGNSWGGNVVMSLAARRAGVAAVCGVEGGWLRLGAHDRHQETLRSFSRDDPRVWYPHVRVPALLCPAGSADGPDGTGDRSAITREGLAEALAGLPNGRVSWYAGTGHQLLVKDPSRLTADLMALAADAEPDVDRTARASVIPGPTRSEDVDRTAQASVIPGAGAGSSRR